MLNLAFYSVISNVIEMHIIEILVLYTGQTFSPSKFATTMLTSIFKYTIYFLAMHYTCTNNFNYLYTVCTILKYNVYSIISNILYKCSTSRLRIFLLFNRFLVQSFGCQATQPSFSNARNQRQSSELHYRMLYTILTML